MKTPQEGIFNEGSNHFTFLEFKVKPNIETAEFKSKLQQALLNKNQVSVVTSFGKDLWNRLQPNWAPEGFNSFNTLRGIENFQMPSTQGDLFFWIHDVDLSKIFDTAFRLKNILANVTHKTIEQCAFTYHDSRDLTGFVDGSANPKEDIRYNVALIDSGEMGEGGSVVFSQKWIHDLNKFNQVPVKEQEQIIGRTKKDSIELEGDDMPKNSHVSRTDVKIKGEAMKIYRRSAPFNNENEHGLFFLSFAKHSKRIDIQLQRMLGLTEDKVYDRIMEFSKAVTGSYWFAPSKEDLIEILKFNK